MELETKSIKAIVDLVSRAPIGEIDMVIKDLQILLGDRSLFLKILEKVVACYNKSHLMPCVVKDAKRKVLTTYFNDMGDGWFCDPASYQFFKLDHITRQTSDTLYWNPNIDAEIWRKFVDEACQEYIKKYYEDGIVCVFGSKKDNCINLTVCIFHQKSKKEFFWSGNWRSVWILNLDPETLNVDVKGYLRVEAHYHENGQAYMNHQKIFTFVFRRRSDCVIGNDFAKRIEQEESKYLEELNDVYSEISSYILKGFRRALPIWKTNMNWNVRVVKPPTLQIL